MSASVNLLLLLSALLSALSGIGAGVRTPQMPVVATRVAEAAIVEAARPRRTTRPTAVVPEPNAVREAAGLTLMMPMVVPLYLSRRRE